MLAAPPIAYPPIESPGLKAFGFSTAFLTPSAAPLIPEEAMASFKFTPRWNSSLPMPLLVLGVPVAPVPVVAAPKAEPADVPTPGTVGDNPAMVILSGKSTKVLPVAPAPADGKDSCSPLVRLVPPTVLVSVAPAPGV